MSKTNSLKDYAINIKIKLAALWTSAQPRRWPAQQISTASQNFPATLHL